MSPAATILQRTICPLTLGALVAVLTHEISGGAADAPQMSTTNTIHTGLYPVPRGRGRMNTYLFNNNLLSAYTHGKATSAKRRIKNTILGVNRGRVDTILLYGSANTERTSKGNNDEFAFSEASSFNERNSGVAQVKDIWSLWKPLLHSTSGTSSLIMDNFKDPLKPSLGRQLKQKTLKTDYILKTLPCYCLIHRIPLTYVLHRPMESSYKPRNLWLFIEYCNKCLSLMNLYKIVFETYVTYQVCYSSVKCAAYSRITIKDNRDSPNYKHYHVNNIGYEEIPSRKEYIYPCCHSDSTWSRFRREFHVREKSKTVDDHHSSSEVEVTAMTNKTNVSEYVRRLRNGSLDTVGEHATPENGTESSGPNRFENRRGLLSKGIKLLKTTGHTIGVLTTSALGTVVSAIMKRVGDEEVTGSVRDVLAGLGRAVSGASVLGKRVGQAIL